MPEEPRKAGQGLAVMANDIATAPGDLPMPEVAARFALRLSQFRHDNTLSPLAPRPDEPVEIWATTGSEMHLWRAAVFYTADGSAPSTSSTAVPMEACTVEWDPRAGFLTNWCARLPGLPGGTVVRYRIGGWRAGVVSASETDPDVWAHDGQGFWFHFPGEAGITTFAYPVEHPHPPMPSWMDDAVIYHIFLDRFHPGTPDGAWHGVTGRTAVHGGTLAGVRQALPYLVELGITCLWFSPLHPAETYHRYDGKDYFAIDPGLGTADEFRDLVDAAHGLGLRIWMDFVPSHCSWHHPAFLAAQRDRSSSTYSWFTFNDWPEDYRSFLQVARTLPSFDTEDPGARAYLIDSAVFWLRNFGVDGFRLDHAIAPSMDFWTAFRAALEGTRPDVVTVGEATDTPDCLRRYRGRLHGILDFPLARALRLAFGAGTWDVAALDLFLTSYERYMAEGPGRVSFLDNHDMDRFLWVAGNDRRRLRLAALCQFTLSATPVMYYGTEVGMSQTEGAATAGFGGDAHARQDMSWNPAEWDQDLLAFYRALIALRKAQPALQQGTRHTVHLDTAAATYAYLRRPVEQASPALLVAMNLGERAASMDLHLPGGDYSYMCLLSTGDTPEVEGTRITLPPMTGAIVLARQILDGEDTRREHIAAG